MTFTPEQIEALDANLDGSVVKERQGFSYIEGWWAVKEANRIFGHGNWSHRIDSMNPVVTATQGNPNYDNGKGRQGYLVAYTCQVSVTVSTPDGDGNIHYGIGYGEGIDYNNCGQAYEAAVKEAETDAMKRALKNWGNPFGLALYDKDQSSVDRVPSDKGYGICPDHGVPYSLSDKQKASGFRPSHKEGDGWCEKPADAPEPAAERKQPEWMTPEYHEASNVLAQLFDNGDQRLQYVKDVTGREIEHPEEVTTEEWIKVKQSAVGDLAEMNGTEEAQELDF